MGRVLGADEVFAAIDLTQAQHDANAPHSRPTTQPAERFLLRTESLSRLAALYTSELSHRRVFVRCAPQPPLLRPVIVTIELPDTRTYELSGIVRDVTPAGPAAGIDVELNCNDTAVFDAIAKVVEAHRATQKKVLVIDDEAIWRSTFVRAIKQLGAHTLLASDGREGVTKLTESLMELDLVVVDLHMPHIDGRGIIERIRQFGERDLKVLLFSAAPEEELEAFAKSGLATQVISKTAPYERIVETLRRALA